jgi:hypothetical protein
VSGRAEAIELARADVAARADGQLVRGLRHAVLRTLGSGDEGRARRARLARDTVERVLPAWRREFPDDDGPQRALALIDGVLAGSVGETEAQRVVGELWGEVDDVIADGGETPGVHVGYAASKALLAALYDEPLDPPGTDPGRGDEGLDPRSFDTAFAASVVPAGGTPWMGGTDTAARRAFWQWWLDRAAAA